MAASKEPTHAGGIVYRLDQGVPEFLLITARRQPSDWVYPKGHIDPGETAEEAAVREVVEESGVIASIVELIDDVRIVVRGDEQRILCFLMEMLEDGVPGEGRRSQWLRFDAAVQRLSFENARASLARAREAIERRPG
jgi:8-oxo-dGTP pyrophosphatase MutT (NUDIX family)